MKYGREDEEEWLEASDDADYPDYYYDYDDIRHGGSSSAHPPLFSFWEILSDCISPTVGDGIKHVGKILLWALIFRIAAQSSSSVPKWACHLFSTVSGFVVLIHFFYSNTLYLLALTFLSYGSLIIAHKCLGKYRGVISVSSCLSFNLISELLAAQPKDWHQIRGAQMILAMKVISLAFDMDSYVPPPTEERPKSPPVAEQEHRKTRKHRHKLKTTPSVDSLPPPKSSVEDALASIPSLLEYTGYALNPGTSVFGPWVKYTEYLKIYKNPVWNLTWMIKIIFSMAFGFMFLTISTCWNPWLIPDENWRWWIAYRDAMSFRASHYFVSYISEATAIAAGFGSCSDNWNNIHVTQPHNIEVPRSLVDVVVSWNMPMHRWLKTYCFKTTIKYGSTTAIFATYFASTCLHGLNFQLGAVLFSLGFYTYSEHKLRKRLSEITDASIEAKRNSHVHYKHKEGEFLVMVVNLLFGLLACFHLAYLGVMFDHSNDALQTEGYSWKHTLKKWQQLGFLSHWVMLFTFILGFII